MFILDIEHFADWRHHARELLRRGVKPESIAWQSPEQLALGFAAAADNYLSLPLQRRQLMIPRQFLSLAEAVACFRDPQRWALLYSIAWRLLFEDRDLLSVKVDKQVAQLFSMHKAVARDKHKMKAFVRFRKLAGAEHFVAWFEPQHLILAAVAPFFVRRFTAMNWSILTPEACAHWDRQELVFTEGTQRDPGPEDDLETLWLEYYRHIFNPARLKLKAMQAEMPKKYWVNLPEAPLIAELSRSAHCRTEKMIENGASPTWEKTAKSTYVQNMQRNLQRQRKQH